MADKTDEGPFSREWWAARRALMADLDQRQARLRSAYPLPSDADPVRAQLERARSDAAIGVALYGLHSPNSQDRAYARAWDAAAKRLDDYRDRER